ncbi:TPA: hypothetical protein HA235_07285 [Candidatus Woesearchaeota archaeon]|nr:nucleotidyltransferase domain-containing protein [Candidatus Woesearchaeota archaeon]HIH32480.1 hypothetical protein [Candidatus Woesearchaeota archaeon]HIH54265.1 hypothetical protein [Candidatus Woesearchaeota archaeon]HIJ02603.1 hypothetical protein [Candidatus Woesearchaeota archaeon]HIJ13866.1 hypothetical protein [Candidatus Woesearchaeota archaeon]
MDTYKLKWTVLDQNVFSLLCKNPTEKYSQRDIAESLHFSPTAIAKSLRNLKDFVIIEKTKTINFVCLNRDNPEVIDMKRIENIKNIYISGLSLFLQQELTGSTVMLFGSYVRGEDTEESDIDIAVIERKDKVLNIDKYEKMLGRKININFYNSWKDINARLKNNILNGFVLYGSVEL